MAPSLLVVGGGRMGGALVAGLLQRGGWDPGDVVVMEPEGSRRAALADAHPGLQVVATLHEGMVDEHGGAVLAVKPDIAEVACRGVGAVGVRRVLSVVAGVAAARLEACLPAGAVVVRAMPNTPALVGAGTTAISGGGNARAADLSWAETVLGAVGSVVRVPERHLDAVTALSGAGPAYVCVVVEALVEAGVLAGLSRELSTALAVGTVRGTGLLLAETAERPEVLRGDVTSPGGATAAGLRALEARAVRSAFIEAVLSALERSRSLGR
ncbi:MAG: pyrroline-5-carboxylate reductase [Acidimicrobiales bacterium]